jgi:hypothetical protein
LNLDVPVGVVAELVGVAVEGEDEEGNELLDVSRLALASVLKGGGDNGVLKDDCLFNASSPSNSSRDPTLSSEPLEMLRSLAL